MTEENKGIFQTDIAKWMFTWGIACLPVIYTLTTGIVIENKYNIYELGISGELFIVAIVMATDLLLELLKLRNKGLKDAFIILIIMLIGICIILYVQAPHDKHTKTEFYII